MTVAQSANTSNPGRFKRGQTVYSYWTGKKHPHSEDTKRKISETMKGRSPTNLGRTFGLAGVSNPNWKGGVSKTKEYRRHWRHLMQSRRRGAPGTHSLSEWVELKNRYKNKCLSCGLAEPSVSLTRDHIMPIARGGSNSIENIQPLCFGCNVRKGTKSLDYRLVDNA